MRHIDFVNQINKKSKTHCENSYMQGCKSFFSALQAPTGVFSRLGEAEEDKVVIGKTVAVTEVFEDDDSDGEGSVLQYAGVLKRPPPAPPQKETPKAKTLTLRRLGTKYKLPLLEGAPPISSSTSSSQERAPKLGVLQRLGKAPSVKPTSSTPQVSQSAETQDSRVTSSKAQGSFALASPKVSSSTGDSHGAQMDVGAVSVFKRLGARKP